MFEHTKGVLKATAVAVIIVFGLSLFIPQQIVLQHELLVNESQDNVFKFLENPENMSDYFPNLVGIVMEDKGGGDFVFIGHDGELYRIELRTATQAKGVELTYYRNDEKQGMFLLTTKQTKSQTMLSQTQFWNLGYNPLTKLLGHQTKKESQDDLEDAMIKLKGIMEQ